MRYFVKARLKAGMVEARLQAIADGTLGRGSMAGDECRDALRGAPVAADGRVRWACCDCTRRLEGRLRRTGRRVTVRESRRSTGRVSISDRS